MFKDKKSPNSTRSSIRFLINPKIKIPDYSTKIHNITNEDVKDQPELFSKADQILSFIKKYFGGT